MHGALAETALVSDHKCTPVVLKCGGKNLARRGAQAVHQNDHWAGVGNFRVFVVVNRDFSTRIFGLNNWSLWDEEAGEIDSLFEGAPTIAAEVYDKPFDIFFFEARQKRFDIHSRALGFPVAAHVRVEGWQRDPANAGHLALGIGYIQKFSLGLLILQLHLIAGYLDD